MMVKKNVSAHTIVEKLSVHNFHTKSRHLQKWMKAFKQLRSIQCTFVHVN